MEKVKGLENGFDLPKHMVEHIYMFAGGSGVETFQAQKYLLDDLVNWFGGGITFLMRQTKRSAPVSVNFAAMRRRALQYALQTKTLSPEPLVEQVKGDLKMARENYISLQRSAFSFYRIRFRFSYQLRIMVVGRENED